MAERRSSRTRRRGLAAVAVAVTVLGGSAGLASCGADAGDRADGTTTTEAPADTTTTEPDPTTTTEATAPEVSLELRPVLAAAVADDDCGPGPGGVVGGLGQEQPTTTVPSFTPTPTTAAPTTTTTARPAEPGDTTAPSEDGTLCYTLGPVGLAGDDLATAEARERANELFNGCFEETPDCPGSVYGPGLVAVVLDGAVISAPAVQSQDLGDDTFQISGAFTEEEARALAEALT